MVIKHHHAQMKLIVLIKKLVVHFFDRRNCFFEKSFYEKNYPRPSIIFTKESLRPSVDSPGPIHKVSLTFIAYIPLRYLNKYSRGNSLVRDLWKSLLEI